MAEERVEISTEMTQPIIIDLGKHKIKTHREMNPQLYKGSPFSFECMPQSKRTLPWAIPAQQRINSDVEIEVKNKLQPAEETGKRAQLIYFKGDKPHLG